MEHIPDAQSFRHQLRIIFANNAHIFPESSGRGTHGLRRGKVCAEASKVVVGLEQNGAFFRIVDVFAFGDLFVAVPVKGLVQTHGVHGNHAVHFLASK